MMLLEIVTHDEEIADEDARVIVRSNGLTVARIRARVTYKPGADGRKYPMVELETENFRSDLVKLVAK
jgi:hypothetical protein